uniref:Integrase core domain containing protein n=1 Tax=Solanum tuberosum TaxID=4113 RepID=M1DL74_SOLTU
MPSPEGENQVSYSKEKSACRKMVPRCSVRSPKVTEREDAEDQSKKAMELTKRWIAEWIGDPDLLRRLALRSIFLDMITRRANTRRMEDDNVIQGAPPQAKQASVDHLV